MAAAERAQRWLYSNKNIAGCVLALGAPVLAVTGVVAPPVALLLLPALYAAGALAAPGAPRVDLVSGMDPDDVQRSLHTIRAAIKGKVCEAVSARVELLCAAIEQVLPRASELGPGSQEMHVLVRTATDYLPSALQPYLALPRLYAEHKPLTDGRTAAQVLCAQLDVMNARMQDIVDAVLRADGDRLIANERFLEDKFGTTSLSLPSDQPGSDGPGGSPAGPGSPPARPGTLDAPGSGDPGAP